MQTLLFLRGPNAFEADMRRLDAEAELGRLLGELKPQEEQVVRYTTVQLSNT